MRARAYLAALPALILRDIDEQNYKIYVTDALRGAFGLDVRYADLIDRKPRKQIQKGEATRSIRAKLGGE